MGVLMDGYIEPKDAGSCPECFPSFFDLTPVSTASAYTAAVHLRKTNLPCLSR